VRKRPLFPAFFFSFPPFLFFFFLPDCQSSRIVAPSFDDDSREDFANASEHAALLAEAGVLQKLVVLLHGDVASAEASATVAKLLVRNEYCKKVRCAFALLCAISCVER
jgi:hypothetical protein